MIFFIFALTVKAQMYYPIGKDDATAYKLKSECEVSEGSTCYLIPKQKDPSVFSLSAGKPVEDPAKVQAKQDARNARDAKANARRALLNKVKAQCDGEAPGLLKDICNLISGD